tara:strand:- start:147 stop:632 length:486 start_codon:yes stop_codon:yes gene_type:complete
MKQISLDKLTWCDASSSVVSLNHVLDAVNASKDTCEIHVGCDSHFVKDKCVFAVVVAMYEYGKGGTYFFARAKIPRRLFMNMKLRLLKEVEIAISLADVLSSFTFLDRKKMRVHLDINPDNRFKSSQVFNSATSWVKSLGYQCVVKPDSWASSWLADAYAK